MAFGGLKGTLANAANSITNPFAVTGSVAVVQGDLVFAVFAEQTNLTVGTVTDNLGHTYTAISAGTTSGTATCRAYYARIVTGGTLTSVSATATASTDNIAGAAAVIEGPFRTPPIDKNIAQITTDTTSPFTCPATGTLSQADEVVIGWGTANYGTVWTATSPNLLAVDQASQSVAKVAIGYQLVAATTTVSPVFAASGNPSNAILGTASFSKDFPAFLQERPNPRGAKASVSLLSAHPTNNLALTVAPDTTPALPSYLWGNPFRADGSRSLLSWTVAPFPPPPALGVAPFSQHDWPVPRGPSPANWLLGWSNEIIGPVPDARPFYKADWPVPQRPSPSAWLLGWSNEVIGPVPPFAGEKPFAQNEWPVPHRNDWPLELLTTLNAGIETPFPLNQYDWPNPQQPRRSLSLLTSISVFPKTTQAPPFHQTEWPNPRGAQPLVQFQVKSLTVEVLQAPLRPFDWPNPQLPRRKPALYDFYQSAINVHPPTGDPFHQGDWPVPKGPVHPDVSFAGNAFLPVGAPGPLKPINQQDWPLPKGARFPIEMLGINSGFLPIEPPTPPVSDEMHFRPFIATPGKMTSM